jgi:predicted ATPase/DNA-binding SARP family transcriptional activator
MRNPPGEVAVFLVRAQPQLRLQIRARIKQRVEFRLLGPFEVESGGRDLTPVRRKQRLLLAALVLEANRVAAIDDLIEVLWGSSPPATARKALHGHIAALRKRLGPVTIETRPPGYLLHAEVGSVDVRRLEALLEAAKGDEIARTRAELLRSALALFRGEPLADFRYEPFARDEAARLEEIRFGALTDRIEADLELGRHRSLIPELELLVAEHPHDERLRGALMLALYRAGRQVEALQSYTETRQRLVDDLGVEPGPELKELERQILNHDPALELQSAPAMAETARAKLPMPATALVGREQELADVCRLLERARLVTLTGTAGSGKTRLALAAAAERAKRFAKGPVFVGLAPVADAELVLPAVAEALGVRQTGGQALLEGLTAALVGSDDVLLVLDNCEHVLDAAPALAELLADAPSVTVLATSREQLHLAAERVYPVPPLSTEAAVRLFAERAEAVKPAFELTEANREVVTEICEQLDGLPLAIELAAARVTMFPPQALLARLDQRLHLLTGAARDRPERHHTLRAAIDWSHELLSGAERALFARFSVFAGGWTPEAAEAVCNGDVDVIAGLGSLIDKSLVHLGGTDEGPRFTMLETMREYAQERLAERGPAETNAVRDRHVAWMIEFAERAEVELRGPDQAAWLERLHAELGNFRAAFNSSVERGNAEPALRLGAALLEFWMVRADWNDGLRWVERALALPGAAEAPARTKALRAAAELADALSDYRTATAYYEESLALARTLGDERGIAEGLFGLSFEAERVGDHRRARPLMEESVAIMRTLGDEPSLARSLGGLAWLENDYRSSRKLWSETLAIRRRLANRESVGWTLIQVGFCAQGEGDYPAARVAYDEALSIGRELNYERMTARSLTQLGDVALLEGHVDQAGALFRECIPTWREIGHRSGLVDALRSLGDCERVEHDLAAAGALLEESLSVAREIGARPLEALALQSIAALASEKQDFERAERLLTDALVLWRDIDDTAGSAVAMRGLGQVAANQGVLDRAARLLGAAEALRERVGAVVPPYERDSFECTVAAVRSGLGEETFATSWAEGRMLEAGALDEAAVADRVGLARR